MRLFATVPAFVDFKMLQATPERHVALPGGNRPSQTDLFVLTETANGERVSIAVEGKVNESFGEPLSTWKQGWSNGKQERLAFLQTKLGRSFPDTMRYQLIHRAGSAVLLAEQYHAKYAMMIVQSFSPTRKHFDDFAAFVSCFGAQSAIGTLVQLTKVGEIEVFAAWVQGDVAFLKQ